VILKIKIVNFQNNGYVNFQNNGYCVCSFSSTEGDTGDGGMEGKGMVYCDQKTDTIDVKPALQIW
jgi:hypothetical protein